ncbi:uncharacterized protein ACR2FA_009161 [Aphomia sociella]
MEVDNDITISDVHNIDNLIHIPEDKPLMQLFKRLIDNDSKQNTILTNAQILDILQKELNTEVQYIHDLEIEIYLNIIKKFLKDWPQWDEFDKTVSILKTKGAIDAIRKLLDVKYNNLKKYLKVMLDMARPLVKDVLDKTIAEQNKDDKSLNVVMEINCTPAQLNKLFFRRPNPLYNNSVFNIIAAPTKINVFTLSLKAILNWFHVRVEYHSPFLFYKRGITHALNHVLVNRKLNNVTESNTDLDQQLQRHNNKKNGLVHPKHILEVINDVLKHVTGNTLTDELVRVTFRQIESELRVNMETTHFRHTFYKQYMNKYAYVRYLYADVKDNGDITNKYDLQLQETVCPRYFYYIGRFNRMLPVDTAVLKWLKFTCMLCRKVFNGDDMAYELRQHIIDYHFDQPDWRCCNCKAVFTTTYLAENKWEHKC